MNRRTVLIAASAAVLAAGCATARSFLALRRVAFDIDNVNRISIAGVPIERIRSYSELGAMDAARLVAAATRGEMPLEFDLNIGGENPADNGTTARLVRMQWTLLLNGTETINGLLDTNVAFPPGARTVVRVPIRLDVLRFFQKNARDAFELACGLANLGGCRPTEIQVRAMPTVDSPLGPIHYNEPITIVRKTVGN